MINDQYITAMRIFSDIFGEPSWLSNPKEGQSTDEIINVWCLELKNYTLDQVKKACYSIVKWKKSMTFPTISHLMSELSDQDVEKVVGDNTSEAQRVYRRLLTERPEYSNLAAQRSIFRVYGIEVGGYKNADDIGY